MKRLDVVKVAGVNTTGLREYFHGLGLYKVTEVLEHFKHYDYIKRKAEINRINLALLYKTICRMDLLRIDTLGNQFAFLCLRTGKFTIKDIMRVEDAEVFHAELAKANHAHARITRRNPTLSEVNSWIKQAKQLDQILSF